jgi:hypothetical protein
MLDDNVKKNKHINKNNTSLGRRCTWTRLNVVTDFGCILISWNFKLQVLSLNIVADFGCNSRSWNFQLQAPLLF